MINRNQLVPRLSKVQDEIEAPVVFADVADQEALGWDTTTIIAAGINAKAVTVKTYGRLICDVAGADGGVWVLLATTVLTVSNAQPAAPDAPSEFTSPPISIPCQQYDKIRHVPSAVTGPVSLWAGGARVTTGE